MLLFTTLVASCNQYEGRPAGLQCGSIGDVDGDGREDVAVAMRLDPATGESESRLLILSGAELEPLALLLWPAPRAERGRAWGLASRGARGDFSLGDLDGDGRSDFALKERLHERDAPDVGGLLVVAGGTWRVLREDPRAPAPAPLVRALQDLGDLDGDGTPDHACVLEPERFRGTFDEDLPPAHDAILRVRSGRTWQVLFELGPGDPWDGFGADVARSADHDGDGVPDLVLVPPHSRSEADGRQHAAVVSGRDGSPLVEIAPQRSTRIDGTFESLLAGTPDDRPLVLVVEGRDPGYGRSYRILRVPSLELVQDHWGRCSVVGDLDGDAVADWIAWTRDTEDFIEAFGAFSGATTDRIWLRRFDWNRDPRSDVIPGVPDAWTAATFEFGGVCDLNGDGLRDVAVVRTPVVEYDALESLDERCGEVFLLHGRTGETLRHLDRAALAELEARCPVRVRL